MRWEESLPFYRRPLFTWVGLCFSCVLVPCFLSFFSPPSLLPLRSFLFPCIPPLSQPLTQPSQFLRHTHIIHNSLLTRLCVQVCFFCSLLVLSVIVKSDHFNTTFTHLALYTLDVYVCVWVCVVVVNGGNTSVKTEYKCKSRTVLDELKHTNDSQWNCNYYFE